MAKKTLPPPAINTRTGKHLKACQCYTCIKAKLDAYRAKVAQMQDVRAPGSPDALIPVRAHFRRSRRYLKKDEVLRVLVERFLAGVFKAK